jgi:hypothetical protein
MIARKILYRGNFNDQVASTVFDIARKNEITGIINRHGLSEVELKLEGDPSVIKLIQHQIEHKVKDQIKDKLVETIPYQYFKGLVFNP